MDVGPLKLFTMNVPTDCEGTFEPQNVKKRQRRLNVVEEIVLSL